MQDRRAEGLGLEGAEVPADVVRDDDSNQEAIQQIFRWLHFKVGTGRAGRGA